MPPTTPNVLRDTVSTASPPSVEMIGSSEISSEPIAVIVSGEVFFAVMSSVSLPMATP